MFYNPYNYNPHVYSNLDVRQDINRFYEHINGMGRYLSLKSGDSLTSLDAADYLSSVSVAPRTLVVLHEHRDFRGRNILLVNKGNSSELLNLHTHLDFNDRTSSIQTFRIC